jgi:hypothetical protein
MAFNQHAEGPILVFPILINILFSTVGIVQCYDYNMSLEGYRRGHGLFLCNVWSFACRT